ncbi:MAG: signal recognition particle receptor subunit alpha, partial [Atribacterota bacterium]
MAEKGGFFKKWVKGFEKITTGVKEQFSLIWSSEKPKEEDWEGLEEMLIQADMGPQLAMDLVEGFRSFKQSSRGEGDWKEWLYTKLESVLAGNEPRLFPSFLPGEMCVILLVGINGVGKTTVAGKLAYMLAQNGEKVSLVAADTFRAAAMDQLEIWAQRAKCHLVKGSPGADPGAVV